MADEHHYEDIWKRMSHCIESCILGTFRNVPEMLCGCNWVVVNVTCKKIIAENMNELKDNDPFDFSTAVFKHVIKEGWDRDPKWRAICAFFLAAAMELDKARRLEEGKFKEVKSVKGDGDSEIERLKREIEKLKNEHSDTRDKVDEIHGKIEKGQMLQPGNSVATVNVHNNHTIHGADEMFKLILDKIKEGKIGIANQKKYSPKGFYDEPGSIVNNYSNSWGN